MRTTEILFAQHIQGLAAESRNLARSKHFEYILQNFHEDVWMKKIREWENSYPIQFFITTAFIDSENVNRLLYGIAESSRGE